MALHGGASFLLHYGARTTPAIELEARFATPAGERAYEAQLAYRSDEALVFLRERSGARTYDASWTWTDHGSGHRESALPTGPQSVRAPLDALQVFHFSDTSRRSPMRTLTADGSNLAAVLYEMCADGSAAGLAAWDRLLFYIRAAAPFVRELRPERDAHGATLTWVDETGGRCSVPRTCRTGRSARWRCSRRSSCRRRGRRRSRPSTRPSWG